MATITFRVDDNLKAQMQELLDYAGIDMTTYYNMITRKAVQEQVIDCYIKRKPDAAGQGSSRVNQDAYEEKKLKQPEEGNQTETTRPNFSDMLRPTH